MKLNPYYDKRDRLLQVRGRLQYSDLPEGMKHQIIVPHRHPVVKEIIQSVHKELLRVGPESTLSVLRQANWLTKGRCEVKRVLGKCLVCQRQRVGPCSQKMAPLPSERVSSSSAFTQSTKAYICIFRCASSGITHLEFTSDLSTDEFFQALIHMISRRGLRSTVWSDNAKTFKSADREIQQLFTQESSAYRTKWIKKSSRLN